MPLTDLAVRNAKPTATARKLSDGGGLQLLVTATGSKLWRLAYRFDGKQKQLALGAYPTITLADARTAREDAKKLLASGIDPSLQAKLEKVARATSSANTFSVIADEYLDKMRREGRADATLEKTTWLLGFARPDLGNRPMAEISAVEVLHVLRKVEARGKLESARRLRSTIGSVFRYAIATARAENDPTFALRGALTTPRVTPRAAVTDEKALGALLRAVDAYDGQPVTRIALQLAALLFPRPGELRLAEWREFDLSAAVWAVPAARTKMRREHRVPLSRQAVQRLAELSSMTGAGKRAFPSVRSAMRPISDGTLNAALRRLGYTKDEATSHGFRATASTLLNESGLWNPDAIERQLAHVEGNDVRRAYARGEHWEERVRMMQWWADRLDELRLE